MFRMTRARTTSFMNPPNLNLNLNLTLSVPRFISAAAVAGAAGGKTAANRFFGGGEEVRWGFFSGRKEWAG